MAISHADTPNTHRSTRQPRMCQCTATTNRHPPYDKIYICNGIQSSRVDVDGRHQTRILRHLAGINHSRGQQTLPTNHRHIQRPLGSIPTEHTINEPKTHDNEPPADPSQEPNNAITNQIFATVEETGRIYTDQTGQFPVRSSNGYRYMLVMYHYDTSAILVAPLKTRHGNELLRGYTKLYQHLNKRGFRPTTHWLDNEASNALKSFNHMQDVEYQVVPPHVHRHNSAERAIRTWKNHFVAGICSTDPAFPLHLWDRLIDQATITLNLLRPARRNPNMSAYQMLMGTFGYNRTPMAPPGTKIVVHEKPIQRRTWDPHGVDGWYIGPATERYRCYRVFINKTHSERITDTVKFFPQEIEMPYPTPTEIAVEATKTLIRTLQNPIPSTPFAHLPFDRTTAIRTIADIFQPYSTPGIIPHIIEEEPIVNETNMRVATPRKFRGWRPPNKF
jgi:hypothetical protein